MHSDHRLEVSGEEKTMCNAQSTKRLVLAGQYKQMEAIDSLFPGKLLGLVIDIQFLILREHSKIDCQTQIKSTFTYSLRKSKMNKMMMSSKSSRKKAIRPKKKSKISQTSFKK